jgi:CRISPR-associated protein Cmr6
MSGNMKNGRLSIISSAGEIIVAKVVFDDGSVFNILNKGYEINDSHNKKNCWVEDDKIYLDKHKENKLKLGKKRKVVNTLSQQNNQLTQQETEMSIRDCIDKHTINKTRLPKETRVALAISDGHAFDNFSLKLNKAARFDCRVKIDEHKKILCLPVIPENLSSHVIFEDDDGKEVPPTSAKYLSIYRPLTEQEKIQCLDRNPMTGNNVEADQKIITKKKRNTIEKLFKNSQYAEQKFRFSETNTKDFLYRPKSFYGDLNNKFRHIVVRQKNNAQGLNLTLSNFDEKIDWRLIVGLGDECVHETSITLHHVYGIPYIPASAIKGVVRNWIITEVFGATTSGEVPESEVHYPLVNAEHRAYLNKAFCTIFGCPKATKKVQFDENNEPKFIDKKNNIYDTELKTTALEKEHQGKVWFFDAFPLLKPNIEVDIMNPHYMPYYSDGEPPADYHDPKPIPFLTVKHGIPFQFLIGIKEKDNEAIGNGSILLKDSNGLPIKVRKIGNNGLVDESADPRLLNITEAWLKNALEEHGIGAKTAVGYGFMQECKTGDAK